jgi:hypothetical protein
MPAEQERGWRQKFHQAERMTLTIVPVPVAAKKASAVETGGTNMANPSAAANDLFRPIRPALTTRAKTRLTERNMSLPPSGKSAQGG